MEYTKEQLQAIDTRDNKMLVSAAAGSGKTAVLVERIIRRILDEESPADIDRMLVMTFTKAAAAQMKEKIIKAIENKRAERPDDPHLMKQAALVHNARITTIHGFCLDVIKDHFQEIGLDPDFRVADEGECRLLKQRVLEDVLESAYEEGSDDFLNMTECLAAGKNDNAITGILDKLYEFSMSDPEPDRWLQRCANVYSNASESEAEDQEWMKVIIKSAELVLRDAREKAGSAHDMCSSSDGPYMYDDCINSDIEQLDALIGCTDYEGYRNAILALSWNRLGRAAKDGPYVDPDIQEKVKKIRNDYKASVSGLLTGLFAQPLNEQIRRIGACASVVNELVRLTREVIGKYDALKREKKVVDFNDLEHMCIRILSSDDGNTARDYREYFEEIYVDEYQDSNLTQEELLKYIARDDNLFMVGDVKQSIYSFRLARPQLFMEKYKDTGRILRIDLHHNFRSRSCVLDTVNELFGQIMSDDLGGIAYDDAARLRAGAKYPDVSEKNVSELLLIPSQSKINDRDLEAGAIASRIKDLIKELKVFDPTDDDPQRMRPLKYSDIVILLRSAKGWDERFSRVLSDEGIPVHVMSRTGYFGANEVSILLDYLTVLDNPLQDIPMAAVLRSAFGCFNDEELAMLHSGFTAGSLYESVRMCAEEPVSENAPKADYEIKKKAVRFIERYDHFREKTGYTSVHELLLEIIDGEYGVYISALNDGKRRLANLNMLLKKAADYGKTSYKGLFHFVRYIQMLKKYEVDYGEANILDENDNAVRIMTIHKSKGLEFPVCFIAGMHKKYNLMDARASIIPDIDIGLGIELTDPVRRIKMTTSVKQAVAKKKLYETLAEEERILYVAMTRAKEKLIMTGIVNDVDEALSQDRGIIRCSSYLDLVLHGFNNAGLASLKINTVSAGTLIDSKIRETVRTEAGREELLRLAGMTKGQTEIFSDPGVADMLKQRFSFRYPYENEKNSFEKISVTELKRRSSLMEGTEDKEQPDMTKELYPKEELSPYIPDFILEQEKEVPSALHGSAVHRIFELWDYDRGTEDKDILDFFEYVKDKGLMGPELVNCIGLREVSDFLNSSLASRMGNAFRYGQLYREQPFIFGIDGVLVQGIIDAYFIEDDRIVIVDYKTDRVTDKQELVNKYHVQLEYYAKALSAMLDKPVGELIIYSTRLKSTVKVPFDVINLRA